MDSSYEIFSSSELEAQSLVWNSTFNFIKSMSLKCAIELGIPDIIQNHGQPVTLSELITSLPNIHPTHTHCIYRLICMLVHSGFFAKHKDEEEEKYSLTLASWLLLKDGPLTITPLFPLQLDPVFVMSWHFLSTWFQNSHDTVFETAHERNMWDFAAQDPKFNCMLNEYMASDSKLIAEIILREYKEVFKGLKSLVDVAGGTGTMPKAIAITFPHMKCTVLDLPHVVANLRGTQNLDFIGGNMFEQIPPANAILLKEAIPNKDGGGKLIIIDMIIENDKMDNKSTEAQLCFDLSMMVDTSGKERNQKEWENLFLDAGFSDYKITPLFGLRSLIEVYP